MATVLSPTTNPRPATHRNYGLPPEDENGYRRPRIRGREVHSRYLSSSSTSSSSSSTNSTSTMRSELPLKKSVTNPPAIRRSHSVERQRVASPSTVGVKIWNESQLSTASKKLITSARSLSVSFQGDSVSIPVKKVIPSPFIRKGTPERRNVSPVTTLNNESLKTLGHHKWPAKAPNVGILDPITHERGRVCRTLKPSGRFGVHVTIDNKVDKLAIGVAQLVKVPTKVNTSKNLLNSNPALSPCCSREISSPLRSSRQPASPSKMISSPRGVSSRSPTRNVTVRSAMTNNLSSAHSVLDLAIYGRKSKSEERDEQMFRMLYNHHLQWRYINAKADAMFSSQRDNRERLLYAAWMTLSELRDSVKEKRRELMVLKRRKDLNFILTNQMPYLEEWSTMERDCKISLSGAAEALKAVTILVPIFEGTRAEMCNLKEAVSSSADVIQYMTSSLYSLLPKAEDVGPTAAELAKLVREEHVLLHKCKYLLSIVEALQAKHYSLRTHLLQLPCHS